MRRPLDPAAVHSIREDGYQSPPKARKGCMSPPKVRNDSQSPPKERRRVSFSFVPDVKLIGQEGKGADDQVRCNLKRLTANHHRLVESWSWRALSNCHSGLGKAMHLCSSEHGPCHSSQFACIAGDVMFIGHEPDKADDALMLSGARVRVNGATVSIKRKGEPTVFQTLAGPNEAKEWASQVQKAADLWLQLEELTETALGAQQDISGDTGGTQVAGAELASGDAPESERRTWVKLKTGSRLDYRRDRRLGANATSNWRWMPSCFEFYAHVPNSRSRL